MWYPLGLIVARSFLRAGLLATFLFAGSSSAFSQVEERERNPSALFHGSVGAPLPNASLPKHIPAPQGQLTFFADYAAANQEGVPLFLVNRTTAPVTLPSQDGDIYMKFEGQGEAGVWEQAQSHINSWCGNSYVSVTLSPGQFFQFRGYSASQGQKKRVRYSCYGGTRLVSNEGEGLIAAEDVEKARNDSMALRSIPETIVRLLLREETRPMDEHASPATRVAALRLLQSYTDSPKLKKDARTLADLLMSSPKRTPEDARAADAIDRILKLPWPTQPSPDALFQRCERALKAKTGRPDTEFGAPETERALVWSVLADLAAREFGSPDRGIAMVGSPNPARWVPIMAMMREALDRASPQERQAIAAILAIEPLADETLSDDFFEKALLLPELHGVCANTLSRRMRWKRLAELGWQLPPEGQRVVFLALARPPSGDPFRRTTRNPDYTGEDKFWNHCMKTQTLKVVYDLNIHGPNDAGQFNRTVHDPLHNFLLGEANRSDTASADFDLGNEGYMLASAVRFLASWNMEEDREVFARLLKFRGYHRQEGARGEPLRPYVSHRYVVRDAARQALLKQGIPVLEGIEIEKDVTGTEAAVLSAPTQK